VSRHRRSRTTARSKGRKAWPRSAPLGIDVPPLRAAWGPSSSDRKARQARLTRLGGAFAPEECRQARPRARTLSRVADQGRWRHRGTVQRRLCRGRAVDF
jgi:hypothetical protein